MAASGLDFEATMDVVLKNIYSSCDPDDTNQVPSEKLIEFISPYLVQDVIAFESLKMDLDPENQNVLISSEKFFEIMNKWAKKIANSNEADDFNCTPDLDDFDEKDFPFVQSTPRASFGHKLLSCEELLNLSNLTTTDLAVTGTTNDESTVGLKKHILEEEVKRLEHQLKQAFAEIDMLKNQVASTEEQNEHLQSELVRCRTRLTSEQQMNELLQKDKCHNEELKEEISSKRSEIENLNKKLHQYEKDTSYMSLLNKKLETENNELTIRCDELNTREQKLKREVFEMKTELEMKEQESVMLLKLNDELKEKLNQEKQINVDLSQENDLLDYKKSSLERRLSYRRYSSFSPSEINKRITSIQGSATPPLTRSPSLANNNALSFNSPHFLKQLGSPISPCMDTPIFSKSEQKSYVPKRVSFIPKTNSNVQDMSYDEDCSFEMDTGRDSSNQQVSLHTELFQTGQFDPNNKEEREFEEWDGDELINSLTSENEILKEELKCLNNEKDSLQVNLDEAKSRIECLSKEIETLQSEKQTHEVTIKSLKEEKQDLENRIKNMEVRYPELLHYNQDKIQELENNLSKVQKEYANLQTQCRSQENELTEFKNKFNFEIPFKNLQIDLNQKNKELDELRQSCLNYKSVIQKLTTTNLELQHNLDQYQKKSKEIEQINENSELTTAQIQCQLQEKCDHLNEIISINESYADKIQYLERELQEKVSQITNLKDMQKEDMNVKNKMWRNYKELQNKTEKTIKDLKDEHNTLLEVYNAEVKKNCELCAQIEKQKEELCEAVTRYQAENDKNYNLIAQIGDLKNETTQMKDKQSQYYKEILEKLSEYETVVKKYDNKIQELEFLNDKLILELEIEKINSEKIARYEEMIKRKENAISNLESTNKSLQEDLEREKSKDDLFCGNGLSFTFPSVQNPDWKTRSFDRQQLIIDRLKGKIQSLESELHREQTKNKKLTTQKELVDQQLMEVNDKFEEFKKKKDSEDKKISELIAEKNSLEERYEKNLFIWDQTIIEQNRKISDIEEVNTKLKLDLEHKDKLLQQQLEVIENNMISNHNLNQTIQELKLNLSNRETQLNNCLFEKQNLNNLCEISDKKLQELSLRLFELEREVNVRREEVKLLSNHVGAKDSIIEELKIQVARVESRLSDVLSDLNERENQFSLLLDEKEKLQERLSKTDDKKEMELLDLEEKVQASRRILQGLQAEIGITRRLYNENSGDGNDTEKKILVDLDVIVDCNKQLYKALSLALKNWEVQLKNDSRFRCIPSLKEDESAEKENFCCLSEKIMIAVMLLEILATEVPMESPINSLDLLEGSSKNNAKSLKKFTLRPAKLVVGRPVSPDSPSLCIGEECGDIHHSIPNSPDSRTLETGKDCSSITSDEFDEGTINAAQLFSPLALSFDDAFPHLTDSFLERIGLHEDGSKQTLSVPETERVFATFAIQIALDNTDIKERLEKQKENCEKQHRRILLLMTEISVRLREHKCIGAMDSIKPVFVLLEDVRYLLREIMQTSGQFGILSCENRMMRCWNMVTNYMAILKKESSLSPIKKKAVMVNKEVGTHTPQEDFFVVEESTKFCSDNLGGDEPQVQNDENITGDIVENRGFGLFSCCKKVTKWLVFLIFISFFAIVSIHWHCQMSSDSQMCPLDAFIQKINIGTPPY